MKLYLHIIYLGTNHVVQEVLMNLHAFFFTIIKGENSLVLQTQKAPWPRRCNDKQLKQNITHNLIPLLIPMNMAIYKTEKGNGNFQK